MHRILTIALLAALAAPAAAQTTHTVTVGANFQNKFTPQHLTVQVGDTVQWVWSSGIHNVDSRDGYFSSGSPVGSPNTYTLVFDAAFLAGAPISGNRYAYECSLHGALGMNGTVTVETPGKPVLTVTDPSPGATVTITASGCTPNGNVVVGYSMAGPGPTNTPYGVALLTPPIQQLPPDQADAAGVAVQNLPVPANVPPGLTVWLQALDVPAGILSNGVRVIV